MSSENQILTVNELAEFLRVHPTTIYRCLKNRAIPGFKIGTDWRFHLGTIIKWCVEGGRAE